ncbi:MAG: hypothetical protein AAB804_01525 [Patescibacteria group bacterium]
MSETALHALVVIAMVVVAFSTVDRLARRPFLSWAGKPLLFVIAMLAVLVLTITWNDFRDIRKKDSAKSGPVQKIFRAAPDQYR